MLNILHPCCHFQDRTPRLLLLSGKTHTPIQEDIVT